MATLLISDLHLEPGSPGTLERFLRLIAGPARSADALYILGDLFEAWIGDDDDSVLATQVADALQALSASGVPIAFQHGNRDFLLGPGYARRCGMRLLDEQAVEVIAGVPTLLMHGDTLCTADHAYLAFRPQVRDPAWQRAFLSRSLDERRAFAAAARRESERHTAGASTTIMDVSADAVTEALRTSGVGRLVHGHTHRPAVHGLVVDGRYSERIVLPDWYPAAVAVWFDTAGVHFKTLD
jgi:UDP-2,3-diacylglucosamine hydrolase